jgi:hypothetical protein
VSLAPNQPQPKIRGFRNTFDVSPWFEGQKIRPESGCGEYLVQTYGEFERFMTGEGWTGQDPVELNSFNPYQMVDATNSDEEHWSGDRYTLTGRRTYCVSYKHLNHYKCIDCTMTDAGKVTGCGARYDLFKFL